MHRPGLRLALALVVATGVVVGAVALPGTSSPGDGTARRGSIGSMYAGATAARADARAEAAAKNLLSRGGQTGRDVVDPTSAADRRAHVAAVAAARDGAEPRLTTARVQQRRRAVPQDRWAPAGGCYVLRSPAGVPVGRDGSALVVRGSVAAERFRFQATDLGQYLLYGTGRDVVATAQGLGRDIRAVADPVDAAVWTLTTTGPSGRAGDARRRFVLTGADGRAMAVAGDRVVPSATATRWRLERSTGCATYPESGDRDQGVSGLPHAGVTPYQEVRGYVDAHTHGMAFEFLGGQAHCGRPWHRFGVAAALVDCPDHTVTGGYGGALETVLSGEVGHDPVGWPTFRDWPAPESLTHEGVYWRWLERSWRGGQRIFVNLLVENNKLCELYPLKRNSCDDMDSVRLQARDMYALQDYIDAQYGGPGRGFYRIVTNPFQARKVINAGQLAVVMGIETSVPFGCTTKLDVPACDPGEIDAQLDEVRALGVRQMELVNKFDNALSGVAGDVGAVGAAVNAANFLETGSFWDMRHCEPADGESHDRDQLALPALPGGGTAGQQDALLGAVAALQVPLVSSVALPLYPSPHHCNARGLTTLGEHTIDGLVQRRMIFDPDHMSVSAREAALDQVEALGYSGVVSSHSWSTPDAYPRIYALGGFVTPYAGDSTGFVDKWRRHLGWADPRYYFGFGYGADINGLGAQGDPRGATPTQVTYPFRGLLGTTIDRQVSGERTWDVNTDGVAQYGLYPDWIQDIQNVAGADGPALATDMARGAEAYLQMWERTVGVRADSCRNPGNQLPVRRALRLVRPGMSTTAVMKQVGQPFTRRGTHATFCARGTDGATVRVRVTYSDAGRVTTARRTT